MIRAVLFAVFVLPSHSIVHRQRCILPSMMDGAGVVWFLCAALRTSAREDHRKTYDACLLIEADVSPVCPNLAPAVWRRWKRGDMKIRERERERCQNRTKKTRRFWNPPVLSLRYIHCARIQLERLYYAQNNVFGIRATPRVSGQNCQDLPYEHHGFEENFPGAKATGSMLVGWGITELNQTNSLCVGR